MRRELPDRARRDLMSLFGLSRDEWESLDGDSVVLDCAEVTRCPVEDPQTWMLAAFKLASDRVAAASKAEREYGAKVVQRAEESVKRIEDAQARFFDHVERQKDSWDREGLELMTGILRRAVNGAGTPQKSETLRVFMTGMICGGVFAAAVILAARLFWR